MTRRRKRKPLPPRRKRMKRAARLKSAATCLEGFQGPRAVRHYARWFGVDLGCALKELRRLGVELDPVYVAQLEVTLRNRKPRKKKRSAALEPVEGLEVILEDCIDPGWGAHPFWRDYEACHFNGEQVMNVPIRPKIQGLCPLLQVFDMEKSLAFYRDLLGFELVSCAPDNGDACDWAWLRLGSAELMLNTMFEAHDRPTSPDPVRVAAHADSTLFIGAPDVVAVHAYLLEQGIPVDPPLATDYGIDQLSIRDPDGYGICFQWPVRP